MCSNIYAKKNNFYISNEITGTYKVIKQYYVKHINSDNPVYSHSVLYEFKQDTDFKTKSEIDNLLFIKWKYNSFEPKKPYYNGNKIAIKKEGKFPFTLIIHNNQNSYIETIQFLSKNVGIHRTGYENGLISEVYFERLPNNKSMIYEKNFPKKTTNIHQKGSITKAYFNRIHNKELENKNYSFKKRQELFGL